MSYHQMPKRRDLEGVVHITSAANPGYFVTVCSLSVLRYGSRTIGEDDQETFVSFDGITTCVACVAYMLVR